MATAPRDTPIKTSQDDTAIGVEDDSMAGRRRKGRRGSRKTRRGGAFQFKTQDVNTAAPPPPNAPQGPLGGRRRRKTRKGRRSTKKRGGDPPGYVPGQYIPATQKYRQRYGSTGSTSSVPEAAPVSVPAPEPVKKTNAPSWWNPRDPRPAFEQAQYGGPPLGGKTHRRRRRGGRWNY